MRASVSRLAVSMLGLALLAGCHFGPQKGNDGRGASGQVLKGSISDAMLAYDGLKSHPPLAPRTADDTHDNAPASSASEAASEAVSTDAAAASSTP